jgi:hypothetical protein
MAYAVGDGLQQELEVTRSADTASALKDYNQLVHGLGNIQLAVPGHELLELLCQMMEQPGSRDGAGSAGSSSSSLQQEALRHLAWHWMPSVNLCRQLQQQQQQ